MELSEKLKQKGIPQKAIDHVLIEVDKTIKKGLDQFKSSFVKSTCSQCENPYPHLYKDGSYRCDDCGHVWN